jgi:hypothetical protein
MYVTSALTFYECIFRTECIYVFRMILRINSDYFLNCINRLIFVMEKDCVFFAVRTESVSLI